MLSQLVILYISRAGRANFMALARRRTQGVAPQVSGEDGDFVQLRIVREVYT